MGKSEDADPVLEALSDLEDEAGRIATIKRQRVEALRAELQQAERELYDAELRHDAMREARARAIKGSEPPPPKEKARPRPPAERMTVPGTGPVRRLVAVPTGLAAGHQAIVDFLDEHRERVFAPKQVADTLHMVQSSVRTAMRELAEDHVIFRHGYGRYQSMKGVSVAG